LIKRLATNGERKSKETDQMKKDLDESTRAIALLPIISERFRNCKGPIVGYKSAGDLIGLVGDNGKVMGQVASRIDYACFVSGLPILTYYWVLTAKGKPNDKTFSGHWQQWKEEIARTAEHYKWTDDEFEQVLGTLRSLPNDSANSLWTAAEIRESEHPGFIRDNLHRKVARF